MRCAAATIPERHPRTQGTERTIRSGGLALAVLMVAWVAPVEAGPWAREDGAVFLSVTFGAGDLRTAMTAMTAGTAGTFDAEPTVSAYGELGLGQGLTAGFDLDWGEAARMGGAFLRYTVTDPGAAVQVAVDGGLALRSVDGRPTEPLLRLGGAVGRGFGGPTDGGWVSLDGAAFVADDGSLSIWRAETTLGLHLGDRLDAILLLKAEDWPQSDPILTARPSLVYSLAEGTSLQGGLVAGLGCSDTLGVSLSLWREF